MSLDLINQLITTHKDFDCAAMVGGILAMLCFAKNTMVQFTHTEWTEYWPAGEQVHSRFSHSLTRLHNPHSQSSARMMGQMIQIESALPLDRSLVWLPEPIQLQRCSFTSPVGVLTRVVMMVHINVKSWPHHGPHIKPTPKCNRQDRIGCKANKLSSPSRWWWMTLEAHDLAKVSSWKLWQFVGMATWQAISSSINIMENRNQFTFGRAIFD